MVPSELRGKGTTTEMVAEAKAEKESLSKKKNQKRPAFHSWLRYSFKQGRNALAKNTKK